jgi:CRP-like cAMP-binding protein
MSKILDQEALSKKLIDMLRANDIVAELGDEEINRLASRAQFEARKVGDLLVKKGEPGRNFYFILEGQVRIVFDDDGQERVAGYLVDGDWGGEYALIRGGLQPATDEVVVDTTLAIFDQETLNWLKDAAPSGFKKLQEQGHRYETLNQTIFTGQRYNEIVAVNVGRHFMAFLANLPGSLILFILGTVVILFLVNLLGTTAYFISACLLGLGFLSALYVYFDWRNDQFIITSERVIHIERILFHGETRHEAPLTSIQDVSVIVPGLVAKIFDYSDISIKTAGAGTILFDGLGNGTWLKDEIFRQREKALERVEALNITDVRHRLREITGVDTGADKRIRAISAQNVILTEPKYKLPPVINFFIPRVREEHGEEIIWRKNIFVFFALVALPLLVGLTLFYLLLAAFFGFFPFSEPDPTWGWILLVGWLFSLVWYAYQYDTWRKDEYLVTRNSIVDYKGSPFNLGGEQRRSGTFDVIQNIAYVTPNLLAKLLNIGHVVIETAGTELTFTFVWVYNPVEVQQEIFKRWLAHKESKIQQDRAYEEQRLIRWIGEFYDLLAPSETNGQP